MSHFYHSEKEKQDDCRAAKRLLSALMEDRTRSAGMMDRTNPILQLQPRESIVQDLSSISRALVIIEEEENVISQRASEEDRKERFNEAKKKFERLSREEKDLLLQDMIGGEE